MKRSVYLDMLILRCVLDAKVEAFSQQPIVQESQG